MTIEWIEGPLTRRLTDAQPDGAAAQLRRLDRRWQELQVTALRHPGVALIDEIDALYRELRPTRDAILSLLPRRASGLIPGASPECLLLCAAEREGQCAAHLEAARRVRRLEIEDTASVDHAMDALGAALRELRRAHEAVRR